ncbi:tetratricopeptide repeat-containing sensor histidine kinase [Arcicella rosea]|uniref:histidine kinase n=1 Tax=Arcicella rosea TaxID=502909 RepID=A0A841EDZ7_9BACT|nr:tetratricopeptide repeat-containing sensor histidine kinase [Arcicella rosea]MBB6002377.1 signal transduction histidine kinase [Arcicella rosea]
MYIIQKKNYLLLLITLLINFQLKAQVLPLTRTDSGRVLQYQSQYDNFLSANNYKEASRMMNEIGFIYWNYNQYKRAISFYEKSLKLNINIENRNGTAMIHNNLGMLYADTEDYEKALYHFTQTLAARRSQKEPYSIISSLINRSVAYNNIKKYNLSINDLQEALNLARELNDIKQMASTYAMLSETYEKLGNVDESLKYFTLYKTFYDELKKKEVKKIASDLESESLKKQLAESIAKTKELELEKNEIKLKENGKALLSEKQKNINLYQDLTNAEMIVGLQKRDLLLEKVNAEVAEAKNLVLEKEKSYVYIIAGIITFFVLIVATIVYLNSRKIKVQNQQLHQQNLAIAAQKEQLTISNDVKNKIFSIIAHDLRGPIASLQSFFEIIEEDYYDEIPEDLKDILSQLKSGNAQISTILDNLLNWAKTQMSELKPKIQEVNVFDLVDENIKLLQRLAEGKEISIINEIPTDLKASSDLEMTKIVFRNLIQNAIKFTKKKGIIKVQINPNTDTEKVEVVVIDSGVGMSEEKVNTLFNLKSNKSTYGTNNEKGTGLGLVLCNDFIKICGGKLKVASELNIGTTITVTLNKKHDA